ncbi:MAG TPA: acyl-CoA reductase [Verrucomicrobiae bacterium]
MHLPNYFLADLPPEADLSPAMVEAACEALKQNRAKYLATRSTADLIATLCEVAQEWLRPTGVFRQLALQSGPEQTGFSQAVLARGIDDFFRRFTPEAFNELIRLELGEAIPVGDLSRLGWGKARGIEGSDSATTVKRFWRGPEFQVHIAAGNLPNPAWMSLVLGLFTRSAQFMKCARGGAFLPRLLAHSIYHFDPKLGACLEIAEWRGGRHELEHILFHHADCVTATGSDETLAAIRKELPARVRFLGYGQQVSFGLVTREQLREETLSEVVQAAADAVIAWDQNGCLSPQVIYVEERGQVESDQFAAKLAAELAQREVAEPRGLVPVAAAGAIASLRATYEAIAVHRGDVKLWASAQSTAWTVIFEHEVRFRFSPLNRCIFIKPVPDLEAVLQGIDELRGRVSTAGVAAGPERMAELAGRLAAWGVTRICPLAKMQNPSLTWRHDGRPALGDLVHWTDLET